MAGPLYWTVLDCNKVDTEKQHNYHMIRVLLHKVQGDQLIRQWRQATDEKLSLKRRHCLKETQEEKANRRESNVLSSCCSGFNIFIRQE